MGTASIECTEKLRETSTSEIVNDIGFWNVFELGIAIGCDTNYFGTKLPDFLIIKWEAALVAIIEVFYIFLIIIF